MTKGIKYISYIIIASILVMLILSMIIKGKASIMGYRPFFIMSESMEPVIMTHQMVLGKTVEAKDVDIGDIVAYRDAEIPIIIIHRVIDKTDEGFLLKGDNNPSPDKDTVSDNQIMYKIIAY